MARTRADGKTQSKRRPAGDWLPEGPEAWPGAAAAGGENASSRGHGVAPQGGPGQGKGLFQQFYDVVTQIPFGKVATYGQIARLAGHPRAARMVGWALSDVPDGANIPCHRVVNREGGLAPGWEDQRSRLEAEGVTFLPDGRVNMERHQW